jgi:hypothetical protein
MPIAKVRFRAAPRPKLVEHLNAPRVLVEAHGLGFEQEIALARNLIRAVGQHRGSTSAIRRALTARAGT